AAANEWMERYNVRLLPESSQGSQSAQQGTALWPTIGMALSQLLRDTRQNFFGSFQSVPASSSSQSKMNTELEPFHSVLKHLSQTNSSFEQLGMVGPGECPMMRQMCNAVAKG